MKRLLVISLVAAAALVPTAAAAGTITVATASSMVPGEGVTIVRVFRSGPRALPRAVYVVTSGPVGSVSTKTSCYSSFNSSWPDVIKATYTDVRRIPLSYNDDAHMCTITVGAGALYTAKPGQMIKIALQVVN